MTGFGRTEFAVAGDNKDKINDSRLWSVLSDEGFNNGTSLSKVGFCKDFESNKLVAILPKAFAKDSAREKLKDQSYALEQFWRLIRILRKYYKSTFSIEDNWLNSNLRQTKDPVLDSFEGAYKLRADYLKNGLYFSKTSTSAKNRWELPVDWHRTLSRNPPLLQRNQFFFTETVHRKGTRDKSDLLLRLQIACLNEIFENSGEARIFSENEMSKSELLRVKRRAKAHLRTIRGRVYTDRGRQLLAFLSAYLGIGRLDSSKLKQRNDLLRYSKNFENIWEHILRSTLSNSKKAEPLVEGKWFDYDKSAKKFTGGKDKGIKPEVDFKLGEPTQALIDGKDYQIFNGTSSFRKGSDHYKQIIYRKLVKPDYPDEFLNVLMFPSIDQGTLFEIQGFHEWKEIKDSRVFAVTVDYDRITKHWLGEQRSLRPISEELDRLLAELRKFAPSISSH
jgi:hypothetical protein